MSAITFRRVESHSDWEKFVQLPFDLHRDDPNWIPPLRSLVRDALDVEKNPFYRHAYRAAFLALEGDRVVGRIVGIIDDVTNKLHAEAVFTFGFYESENRVEVARAFDGVTEWGKNRGMARLRGPMSPSMNYECGLLVEGFDDAPTIQMPHQPKHYANLFEKCGFKKAKDLYAYEITAETKSSDRLQAQAEKLTQNAAVQFRPLQRKDFEKEIERLFEIYSEAEDLSWGQAPMTFEEFRHVIAEAKLYLDPNLVLIAELRGEPAGFAFALPDLNQALKRNAEGRDSAIERGKLLWRTRGPGKAKTLTRYRVLRIAIKEKFRHLGLAPIFYFEYLKRGPAAGYAEGEVAWVSEDQSTYNEALTALCGRHRKTYRIYDRALS